MVAAHKRTIAERAKRVLLWLGFSVIFALLPLFVNFVLIRTQNNGFHWVDVPELYQQGELLLIAAALSADGMGRLFNHKGTPASS